MKKQFFIKLICFFVALLILPVGYFVSVQSLPAMYRGSLMGSIYIKQQLLEEIPGARVVLVGGSSVPYSIECEKVSEALGMPCIAMGATAYLGMEYYLSLIDDFLHEGDIVILAPEFSMLQNAISYRTTWMAVENSPTLMKALPISYLPHMITSYYSYGQQKISLWKQQKDTTLTPKEAYDSFGFGQWGDITTERTSLLESGYDKNDLLTLDENSLSPHIVNKINEFYTKAEKVGATVLMTWAPFDELAYTGTLEELDQFEQKLRQQIKVPYIGDLKECMLSSELFYDSNNHLTSKGATLRTQILLEDLLKNKSQNQK